MGPADQVDLRGAGVYAYAASAALHHPLWSKMRRKLS